jgi:hypothetical protein
MARRKVTVAGDELALREQGIAPLRMSSEDAVEVPDFAKGLDGADDGKKLPLVLLGRKTIVVPAGASLFGISGLGGEAPLTATLFFRSSRRRRSVGPIGR